MTIGEDGWLVQCRDSFFLPLFIAFPHSLFLSPSLISLSISLPPTRVLVPPSSYPLSPHSFFSFDAVVFRGNFLRRQSTLCGLLLHKPWEWSTFLGDVLYFVVHSTSPIRRTIPHKGPWSASFLRFCRSPFASEGVVRKIEGVYFVFFFLLLDSSS